MHISCLFVICIIIKNIDNKIQHVQSNLFHLSYMTLIIIYSTFKNEKQEKLKRVPMSEAN